MKKLMIMMVVLGSAAFGRDFDYREKMDIEIPMNKMAVNQEMSSREGNLFEKNIIEYSDFHRELMNMHRGHDNR